jgi:hypothetical protein
MSDVTVTTAGTIIMDPGQPDNGNYSGTTVSAGGNFAGTTIYYEGPPSNKFNGQDLNTVLLTVTDLGEGDTVIIPATDFEAMYRSGVNGQYFTLTGSEFALGNGVSGEEIVIDISGTAGTPLVLGSAPGDIEYTIVKDSSGSITSVVLTDIACFYANTNIRTPAGDIAVEVLKAGDLVTLTDGRVAPISWLGRQTVSRKFVDPLRGLPVRIKAHALGQALPARDLLISPDHAILVDDILVQAGALVNGVSIVRETDVPETFTYYHVEVADHSLILAENLAAETFIDNVDRLKFDNWEEHEALESVAMTEMAYPRAKSARQVPQSIRGRLLARGQALYGIEVASAA